MTSAGSPAGHSSTARIVVVGAGIVGCALADELTALGATDVTVVEQGPLWAAGGSSSHAPGLVFQCNSSKAMTQFARYTVEGLLALDVDGEPCFHQVGSIEVADRPERVRELYRRRNWLASWGIDGEVITPARAAELNPGLDPAAISAALHVPTDGIAKAVRACEALGRRAISRGAVFRDRTEVTGLLTVAGAAGPVVSGITTADGDIPADIVIMAGGLWAPELAAVLGTRAPLQALAHQLAWTTPLAPYEGAVGATEITTPIVRWQESDLYYRQRHDGLGIGWYGHDPKPVRSADLDRWDTAAVMPSVLPFTPADFEEAWQRSLALFPSLAEAKVADAMDGIFSFTSDGGPLLGPVPEVEGLWAAEAVWVTHSLGVARAVAEWVVTGRPAADVHECDIARFEHHQYAPAYVQARGEQNYVEVYDLLHPLQPMEHPRPLRTTAYRPRQEALGAVFLEAAGWERPQWFQANAPLVTASLHGLERDDWSAQYWSPVAAAEAHAARTGVAMFDMSALTRIDVLGRGAADLLSRVTTGRVERAPGAVTYCLMLDERGGIRSDVTVARLGRDHYQVGGNGPLDVALLRHEAALRGDVSIVDITPGTVCLGVWGPAARSVVQPLTSLDLSGGLKYFRAARTHLGMVPVTLLRVSYVGELGWEIYTTADFAEKLWDTLWDAGRPHGLVAAGRAAFTSLRLEKGYRSYGTDMTNEHTPAEAGLAWALRPSGGYVGAAVLVEAAAPRRRLVTLRLLKEAVVPMGKEPVVTSDGTATGYVTSAGYGHAVGHPIALAWVGAEHAAPGTTLAVRWFDESLPATVAPDVLYDPEMARLRS